LRRYNGAHISKIVGFFKMLQAETQIEDGKQRKRERDKDGDMVE